MRRRFEHGASMGRNRADEAEAFRLLAVRLDEADDSSARAKTGHLARQMWTLLVADLGNVSNGLPETLRAQIISLGLSQIRDAQRLIDGEGEAAQRMKAVCVTMQAALAPRPNAEVTA